MFIGILILTAFAQWLMQFPFILNHYNLEHKNHVQSRKQIFWNIFAPSLSQGKYLNYLFYIIAIINLSILKRCDSLNMINIW